MRTLHIISSIDARYGGPAEVLKRLAAELGVSGHSVDVVCLDAPTHVDQDDAAFGRVIRLGHQAGKYAFSLPLIRWLTAHAKEYDAIVVDGLWQFHGAAALVALRPRKIPYFVVPHGMLDPWFNNAHPLKYVKKLVYWTIIERHLIGGAKAVLFTAQSERELARKAFPLYKARETVVVIGTAPPPAARGVDVQQWRSARALDKTRIILFLGRIHEKKGCDLLIRSFRDLQSMGHRYHLVIAGPDESGLEEKLRDLAAELGIADMITWTGLVKGSDKWSLLRCADVLVLPSHQENFGLVVSEALACGVPVLLTYKVGVWPEVVADGAGLADEDTQGGITRLLMRWATMSDEDKAAMRSAAERCFNERYHVKRVAQNYVALVGGINASLCVSRPIG